MVFPLGSHLADVPRLVEADVNICMYREFGRMLCEALERPYLQAPIGLHSTTNFLRTLGELLGLDPEPFIEREKHTTIKPMWDLWRSVTQDFFGTASFARRRQRDLRPRRAPLPRRRDGPALHLRGVAHAPARRPTTPRCAAWCASKTPLVLFGSYNERMYLAEVRRRAGRCSRLHPGLVPRRDHPPRTPARPSWATPARPTWCRKSATRCSTRCSTSCRWAPSSTGSTRRRRGCTSELPWDDDAKALLDDLVEAQPVLVRISAAKRLRDRAEREARRRGEERVTARSAWRQRSQQDVPHATAARHASSRGTVPRHPTSRHPAAAAPAARASRAAWPQGQAEGVIPWLKERARSRA